MAYMSDRNIQKEPSHIYSITSFFLWYPYIFKRINIGVINSNTIKIGNYIAYAYI